MRVAIQSLFCRFFIFILLINFVLADELLLLNKFDQKAFKDANLSEYLMSEKLDGVRGIWDGKGFKSRKNYPIKSPEFFRANFPSFVLDGELYLGKNSFDTLSALLRKDDEKNTLWRDVTYNVFDVPNACEEFKLNPCSLKNRLSILEKYLEKYPNSYIKIIPHFEIQSQEHLEQFYQKVLKEGGEGLVIRKNNAPYEKGRTNNALKLKPYEDAECKVVGYTQGRGKFEGMVGALLCQMPNGKIIKIGSDLKNKDRANPPQINAIITYKFSGYTKNNLPRFPIFLRLKEPPSLQ